MERKRRMIHPSYGNRCMDIHKREDQWSEEDIRCDTLNAKAMNALVRALSTEFNRVSTCWDNIG